MAGLWFLAFLSVCVLATPLEPVVVIVPGDLPSLPLKRGCEFLHPQLMHVSVQGRAADRETGSKLRNGVDLAALDWLADGLQFVG